MIALRRRLLRLEGAHGIRDLADIPDDELDARLRAELAGWLCRDPDTFPADARAEVAAFLAVADAGGSRS